MRAAVPKLVLVILLLNAMTMWAQWDEGDDNRKSNGHLGLPISIPLNPMGQVALAGTGITYGAGYNFTKRHGVFGEFMWDWLHPNISSLPGTNSTEAHSNLYTFTGNYRYELRGRLLGAYLLAGGGWYLRHSTLTGSPVAVGSSITCTREWLWWGVTCTSGVVTDTRTLRSSWSSSPGVNGGIGFTIRVGDAPWRMYVESRYHYAPNRYVNTQLVITTIGIRY